MAVTMLNLKKVILIQSMSYIQGGAKKTGPAYLIANIMKIL